MVLTRPLQNISLLMVSVDESDVLSPHNYDEHVIAELDAVSQKN